MAGEMPNQEDGGSDLAGLAGEDPGRSISAGPLAGYHGCAGYRRISCGSICENVDTLSSVVGAHNFEEDSAKNQRADEVYIRTDISDRLRDPDRTVVRLRRAHRWFWTTLVETDSFGVEERLKWVNDDTLEVTLGFGCLTHMTHPVEQIGSIRVSYHFSDDDKTLAKGCPD